MGSSSMKQVENGELLITAINDIAEYAVNETAHCYRMLTEQYFAILRNVAQNPLARELSPMPIVIGAKDAFRVYVSRAFRGPKNELRSLYTAMLERRNIVRKQLGNSYG
jgi:hypothetical protein